MKDKELTLCKACLICSANLKIYFRNVFFLKRVKISQF